MNSPNPIAESINEVMETPYITMWIKDGIMYCKYANGIHVSLDVAKTIVEARIYFSKGKSYQLLIDMRGIKSTTKEARRYLATIGATLVMAGALITGSPLNRALGNIFLTIDKPSVPTKLFTSETKALEWLNSLR
jgi:hypothetical protein